MNDLFSIISNAATLAATIASDPSVVGRDKLAAQVLAEDLRALRQLSFRFSNYIPQESTA
ncbi:hypothetical protein ACQCRI_15140 [Ralstonia pseudosolanacearum]|uniref:hypothetical protein n=1 Tax=Ralstonia pseudosolanacearum TaxID=1310165 RepID=UPI000B9A0BA1|nr:hypothetical protein [Ralstonia sp. RS647]AST86638.1 hypothetical protein CIG66_09335 [Ralstonia pseudosolanacearum]NKA07975.1 hypothetical protein [Ralstonia solanacearum]QKL61876.1 hypothetical protein HI812_09530 [Ralstonia solanacearum]QKL66677.1 hypothetical protein HI808_09530 [Ralstonia solanacearum]QKM42909.1 hypothetical protein HI792_09470 [Ralstonia solanacearum]